MVIPSLVLMAILAVVAIPAAGQSIDSPRGSLAATLARKINIVRYSLGGLLGPVEHRVGATV